MNNQHAKDHFIKFIEAQNQKKDGIEDAKNQLSAGKKTGHWIWYILPQLAGLGNSPNAIKYAIKNLDEAKLYLMNDTLRKNYQEIVTIINNKIKEKIPLTTLMGSDIDVTKMKSSVQLFRDASRDLYPEIYQICNEILEPKINHEYKLQDFIRFTFDSNITPSWFVTCLFILLNIITLGLIKFKSNSHDSSPTINSK